MTETRLTVAIESKNDDQTEYQCNILLVGIRIEPIYMFAIGNEDILFGIDSIKINNNQKDFSWVVKQLRKKRRKFLSQILIMDIKNLKKLLHRYQEIKGDKKEERMLHNKIKQMVNMKKEGLQTRLVFWLEYDM